jgi:hypothetical protein
VAAELLLHLAETNQQVAAELLLQLAEADQKVAANHLRRVVGGGDDLDAPVLAFVINGVASQLLAPNNHDLVGCAVR